MFVTIKTPKTNKHGDTLDMSMTCNAPACKAVLIGTNKTDVFLQSKSAGWLIGKTNQHVCPEHRSGYKLDNGIAVVRTAKPAKAEGTVSKSKVAQTKLDKGSKPVAKKVASKTPAKNAPVVGQSIGKLAKTAKSAKKA